MVKVQPIGMQRLTADPFHIRIVKVIPDQRKAQIFQMDPDLMGAPCFKTKRDQAVAVLFLYNLIMRHRALSLFKIHLPLND